MTDQNMPDQPTASTRSEATHRQAVSAVPRKSERFDAFLSHNSQDKPDVDKIREKLEVAGIKVWIDRNELSGGDSLPTTLKRALENSAACVVFIGAHGVGPWQEKEIVAADKLKRPKRRMIPVFLPGSAHELPALLKEKELLWIDFRDFDDQLSLEKLIKGIRTKVKDQTRWDRIRQSLIAAGVCIPLLVVGWATKEFCTFQAEFEDAHDHQRQEVVITRRFDPRPKQWQFRQGTWIFRGKGELRDLDAENKVKGLELNVGWSPIWTQFRPVLSYERLWRAELEWFDKSISDPKRMLETGDFVAFGRAEPERIIEALVALFKDDEPFVRSRAAESLGQLGKSHATVIEALVDLLKDQDSSVRFHAAESLIQLRKSDPNAIEALVSLLHDQDWRVCIHAAECLMRLGKSDLNVTEVLVALLEEDQDSLVRVRAAESLIRLGKSDANVIEALVALLKDPDSFVCAEAAASFVQLGKSDTNVVDTLFTLLKKKNLHVRYSAVESLVQLGKNAPNVVEALVALLDDQDRYVCSLAAAALVRLGKSDTKVIETVVELIQYRVNFVEDIDDEFPANREKSDACVIDAFVALIKNLDSDISSRTEAQFKEGWKIFGDTNALLVASLEDQSGKRRSIAAAALGQLGMSDTHVLEALFALLKDQDPDVRESATNAFGQLSQARAKDWTELELRQNDIQMIADLADNDSLVRERAGIVLAYRRQKVDSELTPKEIEYLKDIRGQVERLRKDPRPWVRQASLHALYHIEKRKAELETVAQSSRESQN